MTSSVVAQGKRESSVSERFPPFDDSVSLRLTPTPSGNYRCPVSTPANFVQCTGKVRRTKPLHDVFRSTQAQTCGPGRIKAQRSRLTALSRASRHQRSGPRTGRGIDYYFVDPQENKREEEVTNGHWLKALCAQPVEEILGKYRRRTEQHRAQLTMVRACSTPGERSIITAWESNVTRSRSGATSGRTTARTLPSKPTVKSAVPYKQKSKAPGCDSASSTLTSSPDGRATKSEPALSRVRRSLQSVEKYGLSPRTPVTGPEAGAGNGRRERTDQDRPGDVPEGVVVASSSPDGASRKVKGFLLDEECGDEGGGKEKSAPPRYVSFTAQLFRHTDDKGNSRTYSKITRGPEHLPYISNSKRVVSMVSNTRVYGKAVPDNLQDASKAVPGNLQDDSKSVTDNLQHDSKAVPDNLQHDSKTVPDKAVPDKAETDKVVPDKTVPENLPDASHVNKVMTETSQPGNVTSSEAKPNLSTGSEVNQADISRSSPPGTGCSGQ